jgi:2-haloacid dehalogenase
MLEDVTGARVVAFDVNETLLDLSPLDPLFERSFGAAALRRQWFAQMLQIAFVGAITGRYVDFTSAQRAALDMLAAREGVQLAAADADAIVDAMRSLPPHADVVPALRALREAGHSLCTLTNSPLDVVKDQLRRAGLTDHFDAILSADQVKALKPRREPYALVARTFDVALADVWLVAAHHWDVAGALAAGCAAAFVARPGMCLSRFEQPDIVGHDLIEVARQLNA